MKRRLQIWVSRLTSAGIATILITSGMAEAKGKGGGWFVQPTVPPPQAVEVIRNSLPQLTAGMGWLKTGKRGEVRLEVPLMFGPEIVGRIGVHPTTGEVLPKGAGWLWRAWGPPASPGTAGSLAPIVPRQATEAVAKALAGLTVGPGAWLAKHGEAWHVPLVLQGVVIGNLRVDSRSGALLPDWKAGRDSMFFGRWAPVPSATPRP